jgi:hypothetical protein
MAAVWNSDDKKSIRLTRGAEVLNLRVGDCIMFTGDNDHDKIKQITAFYFSGEMGPPTAIECIAAVRHSDAVRVVAYVNGEDRFASRTNKVISKDVANLVKVDCNTGDQKAGFRRRRNTRRQKLSRRSRRSRSRRS